MLIESIILIIYMSLKAKRVSRISDSSVLDLQTNTKERFTFVICLIFIFTTLIIRPDFYSGFSIIFDSTNIRLNQVNESTKGILYTLFSFLFPLVYLSICLFLIKKINVKIFSYKVLKTVLNLLVISIPLFFMNNSDGFTLICMVSLALVVYRIRGISKTTFYGVVGGTFLLIFLYILLMVANMSFGSEGTSTLNQLSKAFQAYFPGVCNFAGFFNVGGYNKAETLFYDLYSTIPFRNTLFGVQGDRRLVVLYAADNGAKSQIIPCICQLFYYLSIFAPFVECLYIKFCLKFYEKSKQENSVYKIFIYYILFLYCALAPIMYNSTIFFTRCMQTIFPMMIVNLLISKRATVLRSKNKKV